MPIIKSRPASRRTGQCRFPTELVLYRSGSTVSIAEYAIASLRCRCIRNDN
ncbi:hypothetical protein QUA20_12250 [Microcoleus sp. Pol7_A1]|uniref:hypothetical protein n=1 Tax=Microcoleus sp. Pol7_A1 TaxID=2818893 RepID=UPI002FD2BC9A